MRFLIKELIIVFFLILFINLEISPQEYTPFNFTQGVWLEEYFSKGNSKLNQYYCQGDTIIDGKTFNKLYEFSISYDEPYFYPDTTFTHYIGAIRNNDSKQVFYRNLYDTSERLIYDFNLKIGDTISRGVDDFVINEIDSIEYCGIYRKRYIQQIFDPLFPEILIEGIGYSNGLFGYYNPFFENLELYTKSICYKEWNNQLCTKCDLLLGQQKITKTTIIFPNPTYGELYINSVKLINNISVFEITGRKVYSKRGIYSLFQNIDLDKLKSGIYIILIEFIDFTLYSEIINKI